MRKTLDQWIIETKDRGQDVESMKMYDSDMQLYLDGLAKRGRGDRLEEIKANIALMKKARDRCDETYDRIRAVRTLRYKYIRNGYPDRPHLQPCAYKDNKDTYIAIRDWGVKGKLNDLQKNLLLSSKRAKEELYDLKNDPWELNNLADDPDHAKALQKMRKSS